MHGGATKPFEEGFVIEDAVAPGSVSFAIKTALVVGSRIVGQDNLKFKDNLKQGMRLLSAKAIENSFVMLSMSYDNSNGKIMLGDKGHLKLKFPHAGDQKGYQILDQAYQEIAKQLKGTYCMYLYYFVFVFCFCFLLSLCT